MPPTVYMREGLSPRNRFHRIPDCDRLRGPSQAVDLNDVVKPSPCRTCYRDAPRVKVVRRYCPDCDTSYPCPHNGGVQVLLTGVTTYTSALRDPGDTYTRRAYVWPDRAHHYITD